jgi:hypothetical protein
VRGVHCCCEGPLYTVYNVKGNAWIVTCLPNRTIQKPAPIAWCGMFVILWSLAPSFFLLGVISYLFPSSEIRWFPTLYYAWEWRCFLGYRTQKTLHEPPQKGLSSQQHSFLYRWIGTYRMKETKIESKFHFPLDPAEIFCNSTCFYKFEGQLVNIVSIRMPYWPRKSHPF